MDDRNFVFLMSLIWGLGAHYIWANPATSSSMPIPTSLLAEMMKVVDVAYSRITASPTLETVQIAILLGSFHLFNGSPYLGFAIFGSGVRCAQAIGLHRQPRTSSSTGESCLVWWALEISDKSVEHPAMLPLYLRCCQYADFLKRKGMLLSHLGYHAVSMTRIVMYQKSTTRTNHNQMTRCHQSI